MHKRLLYKFLQFHFLVILILSTISLKSQDGIRVIRIDNSNFPLIEVYIRAEKKIDPSAIQLSENGKNLEFSSDTIASKEIKKGRSLLFVLNYDSDDVIKRAVIKTIKSLQANDKINLGIILKSDAAINIILYSAPEFSSNHDYFIHIIEQDLYKNTVYKSEKINCKQIETIEKNLFNTSDDYFSKGVIFICDKLDVKKESCSKLLINGNVPTYILITKEMTDEIQESLINVSTTTGGIYTLVDEKEIVNKLKFYLEDIALNESQKKTELFRLKFKTGQNKEKNTFILDYGGESERFLFTKPQKRTITKPEFVLSGISGILLIIIFILILKRNKMKKRVEEAVLKVKETPVNPIEINVKAEGFTKTYFFAKPIIRIGRGPENDVIIPDRTVSTAHAVINKEGNNYMIQDLGSTNGIKVNQVLAKKHKLKSKDKIKLGGAILIVQF